MRQISAEPVEWFQTAFNSGELSWIALAHELYVKENRLVASAGCV